MAVTYYALLTTIGAGKLANATALGTTLKITQLALGDGGGSVPTPDASRTTLVNEVRRAPLNQLSIDAANPAQIIAEQVIPEDVGGWWIREMGLNDQSAFNGVFRGSFMGQKGANVAVIATVRGMLKEIDPGDWKIGDLAAFKYSVAVSYYKLEVDGREVFEIDPANGVRVVDGVDQLAAMRSALGV